MRDETGTEWEDCVHCLHPKFTHVMSEPEGEQYCQCGHYCSCPNFETRAQKLRGEER